MLKKLIRFLFPNILVNLPAVPDKAANWGLYALMNACNNITWTPFLLVGGTSTAITLTAAQIVKNGWIFQAGTPGGGVADTLDTAVNIIAAMGGPNAILTDGNYSQVMRLANTTGQTITITASTGITLNGTMTIATGAWRDLILTVTSPTTLTVTNGGGGTV